MKDLIGTQLDTTTLEQELASARKGLHQLQGTQRKLENQLDQLDVTDPLYERKYESLSRRLNQTFEAMNCAEEQIANLVLRLENIKQEQLSRDSVYEYLIIFDQIYDKMTDKEKSFSCSRSSKVLISILKNKRTASGLRRYTFVSLYPIMATL